MRRPNKKRSMVLMAGVLASSIVVGNAYWLAAAEEIDNSTEVAASAEEAAAVNETDAAESTGNNQTDAAESTGSDETDAAESTGSDETDAAESTEGDQADTAEQADADQPEAAELTGEEQSDGTAEEGITEKPAAEDVEEESYSENQNSSETQQQEKAEANETTATAQEHKIDAAAKTDEDASVEASYPAVESNSEWTGDSVPGWVDSDQEYISGNLAAAEQYRLLEQELNDRVNRALSTYHAEEKSVAYEESNFLDIFAIYAVKHDMTEDFPYNVEFEDQEAREELVSIFNRMTRVNKLDSNTLMVVCLSYEEVMDEFELDDTQQALAASLVNDDARTLLQEMYDTSILSQLSAEEFAEMESALSEDISGARRSVLLAALSLEGKVNYFWGGKSYHVGWDERWGQQGLVSAAGSSSTGSVRSYGLDCSGFVSWAFINGGGDQSVIAYIGNGTASQFSNSCEISWEEAQPGDLVFYKTPNAGGINHVGIVLSTDESEGIKIVHCSSGNNGVVVTGKAGFQYIRRPYIYSEN